MPQLFLDRWNQPARLALRPNRPCQWQQPEKKGVLGIRKLRLRDIHDWTRLGVQPLGSNIADDTDNLPHRLVLKLLHPTAPPNRNPFPQRIAVLPILESHA